MISIKPMGLTFTPFISYHEINVRENDLLDDAWGLKSEFGDVIQLLDEYKPDPGSEMVSSLIELFKEPK
jgi:hypothetical protein